ncbi:MAG: hypothetical protein QMB62_09910 [Oscillospiraceae bacterium]
MDDENKTLENLKKTMEIDEEIGGLKGQLTAMEKNQSHLWCMLAATVSAVVLLMIVNVIKYKT